MDLSVYKDRFLVVKIQETSVLAKCDCCDGKGKKKGKIYDEFLEKDFEIDYSCPVCNGTGQIETEEKKNYDVMKVIEFGKATIFNKDGDEVSYLLASRETRENLSSFLDMNKIVDITLYPQFLDFIYFGENQKVFDSVEEANEEILRLEKEV